jgi:hypothetical protein
VNQVFLVGFDYRTGGLWAYVEAESPEAIKGKYPELEIFRRPPDWMSPDEAEQVRKTQTYNLVDEPRSFLALLLAERERKKRRTATKIGPLTERWGGSIQNVLEAYCAAWDNFHGKGPRVRRRALLAVAEPSILRWLLLDRAEPPDDLRFQEWRDQMRLLRRPWSR